MCTSSASENVVDDGWMEFLSLYASFPHEKNRKRLAINLSLNLATFLDMSLKPQGLCQKPVSICLKRLGNFVYKRVFPWENHHLDRFFPTFAHGWAVCQKFSTTSCVRNIPIKNSPIGPMSWAIFCSSWMIWKTQRGLAHNWMDGHISRLDDRFLLSGEPSIYSSRIHYIPWPRLSENVGPWSQLIPLPPWGDGWFWKEVSSNGFR